MHGRNRGTGKRSTNCRTGKRGKRHVWKAKRCTSHLVFNRISDTGERVRQYVIQKGSISAVQTAAQNRAAAECLAAYTEQCHINSRRRKLNLNLKPNLFVILLCNDNNQCIETITRKSSSRSKRPQ